MDIKKTVLIIRNAAKNDFGGAETYSVSLSKILDSQGYHSIIVTRSQKILEHAKKNSIQTYRGWWWSKQNWSGIKAILFPVYIVWQILLMLWYIRLIIRTRASAVHIQGRDDFIAATFAGRICNKRVIWTDHMDLRYIFQNISKPFRNPVGKFVFLAAKFAHHIILISNNEYNLVTAHLKHKDELSKQIIIIKNGVIDCGQAIHNGRNDLVVFCLASRIVENKGIGEAIMAFKGLRSQLSGKKTNVKLAIYGDGPDLIKFKGLAKGIEGINFYGHQENAIEKIRESDVFILPSYQEGFSIALLEATMLGKAIIASNVDSNPEIIINENTGLLVKSHSSEDLRNAMYRLTIDNNLRHRLEINARKNYDKNFNLLKIVQEEIIPLYDIMA